MYKQLGIINIINYLYENIRYSEFMFSFKTKFTNMELSMKINILYNDNINNNISILFKYCYSY